MNNRLALLALAGSLFASPAAAEPNASTTVSAGERYEIVQSSLAARWTFRLDRFCGAVSQLVSVPAGGDAWQAMPIEAQPACVADGRPHYLLFSSGIASRHTFLMNTATGRTWELVTNAAGDPSWQRFAD